MTFRSRRAFPMTETDEKLIAAEVRRLKGETDIPGVKVSSRIEVR